MDNFNLNNWIKNNKSKEDAFFTDLTDSDNFYVLNLVNSKRHAYPVDRWKRPDIIESEEIVINPNGTKTRILNSECDWEKFERLFENNQIPSSILDFGYFILHKSSKVTDIICSHDASIFLANSLLLSSKVIEVFSHCIAGKKGIYPTAVEHKEVRFNDYFLFKYSVRATDYIDYNKSIFYSQDDIFDYDSRKIVELNSLKKIEDYSIENEKSIYAKQIVFNSDFPDFDLFYFNGEFGLNGIFVSNSFASKLNGMTGITLEHTNRLSR
jgi:hypothetical protein